MATLRFALGSVVSTPGALAALKEAGQAPLYFLNLHASGAWGDLDREDRQANEDAISHEGDPEQQGKVFSSYQTRNGATIWIITEHDRSVTTLLLPNEY
jgi:hypothetical protein